MRQASTIVLLLLITLQVFAQTTTQTTSPTQTASPFSGAQAVSFPATTVLGGLLGTQATICGLTNVDTFQPIIVVYTVTCPTPQVCTSWSGQFSYTNYAYLGSSPSYLAKAYITQQQESQVLNQGSQSQVLVQFTNNNLINSVSIKGTCYYYTPTPQSAAGAVAGAVIGTILGLICILICCVAPIVIVILVCCGVVALPVAVAGHAAAIGVYNRKADVQITNITTTTSPVTTYAPQVITGNVQVTSVTV
jgi:hypothetical protein